MNISDLTGEEIKRSLSESAKRHPSAGETIRILFAPTRIDRYNLDEAGALYSQLCPDDYETVVIVESSPSEQKKKLPMPSHKQFKTSLGAVPVDDKLRNDLCDEDDDFYIDDQAYHDSMSLYDQLILLQSQLEEFKVVSIQITDEHPDIIRELAHALEEVLGPRPALTIFCCNLDESHRNEFDILSDYIETDDLSGLMNHLNSGESYINGKSSFLAGTLLAGLWGLEIKFAGASDSDFPAGSNLLSGYAEKTPHQIFG